MIAPDSKDWTWVISQPCPECGFDGSMVDHIEVAGRIRADAGEWPRRLSANTVAVRPQPSVWSVLEYGCHIRDVHRIFNDRVRIMLDEDEPHFANWDQDATAIELDYGSQDPFAVTSELLEAARTVAVTYEHVPPDAWSRRGFRSNGSEFTVASIAVYHLHDIVHHAHDVDHG